MHWQSDPKGPAHRSSKQYSGPASPNRGVMQHVSQTHNASLPGWLRVTPVTGVLMPRASAELTVTALVDRTCAQGFNADEHALDSRLLIKLVGGQDYTIAISGSICALRTISRNSLVSGTGSYQKSVLGGSLDYLRRLPSDLSIRGAKPEQILTAAATEVPYVLFRLLNLILLHPGQVVRCVFGV